MLKYDHSNLQQWINESSAVPIAVDKAIDVSFSEAQFDCGRCGTKWSCPPLTPEQRREAAELVRRAHIFDTLAFLKSAGFTLAEAKPTYLHITLVPGKCHKCSRALVGVSEQVVCCCRSLNLNW